MVTQLAMWGTFAATTAPEGDSVISGWLMLLIVVAVFVVPFTLGSLIAKSLKLKDVSFRLGIVLLTLVLGLTPFVYQSFVGGAEARLYAAQKARWDEKGQKFGQVTEAGVEKLREAMPDCDIRR